MRTFPAGLLALALLAGCLSGDDGANAADDCPASPWDQPGLRLVAPTVDPIDDNRDNATLFETTNVRTCTLPAIGWDPLHPSGTPHKYLGELDMRGDLNLGVVAVPGNTEAGGAYLVDITNRSDPVVVSFIDQPGAYVVDAKLSDDGNVLYLASQSTPGTEFVGTFPEPVSPTGFTVYDIRDPANPQYLGAVVDENGCHMLDPVQLPLNNGLQQDAVMCISTSLKSYLIQRTPSPFANLGFVAYLPNNAQGIPTPTLPNLGLPIDLPVGVAEGPHDMTAFHTGGTFGAGDSYLVVSHWGEGVKVLDITEAPALTEIGSWDGEGATHYAGNVHTAMMVVVGSDRYIIASPEYTFAGVVPGLWVLDANDLTNLKLVAEWYHPGNHTSQGLYLTTHQWQVAPTGPNVTADDVRIYLSYNHAGVWVLDLGHILKGHDEAAILGFNLARTPIPEEHVGNAVLSTWDINVVDGYIYGTDRATGLWVFHYTGDELGDERLRGFS
ncbi:MAG: hypothetical protein AABY18_01855 [Candidatus Thermoplasmatota archaeon]